MGGGSGVVRVEILGPVRAWHGGRQVTFSSPGQRAVLGLLALAGGRPVTRAELVDALWEATEPPPTAANVIQTHVKNLRRLLEPDRAARSRSAALPRVGDGYAIGASEVDLVRFRALAAEATEAARRAELATAVGIWQRALALWRGAPLVDVPSLAQHPKVVALTEERRLVVSRYRAAMITVGRAADVRRRLGAPELLEPRSRPTTLGSRG